MASCVRCYEPDHPLFGSYLNVVLPGWKRRFILSAASRWGRQFFQRFPIFIHRFGIFNTDFGLKSTTFMEGLMRPLQVACGLSFLFSTRFTGDIRPIQNNVPSAVVCVSSVNQYDLLKKKCRTSAS